MPVLSGNGFQFALVKEIFYANAQKRQIEEKIKAAEEWNKLLDQKATRQEIEIYKQSIPHKNDCQLSLNLDEVA